RQRDDGERARPRVEGDVEPGPARAADEGSAGEDGELRGPGPEEVERAPERREVPPRERAAAAAEPEDLEEHAPEDGLLERRGLEPPRTHVGDPAHPGREATEEEPPVDVKSDLDEVG